MGVWEGVGRMAFLWMHVWVGAFAFILELDIVLDLGKVGFLCVAMHFLYARSRSMYVRWRKGSHSSRLSTPDSSRMVRCFLSRVIPAQTSPASQSRLARTCSRSKLETFAPPSTPAKLAHLPQSTTHLPTYQLNPPGCPSTDEQALLSSTDSPVPSFLPVHRTPSNLQHQTPQSPAPPLPSSPPTRLLRDESSSLLRRWPRPHLCPRPEPVPLPSPPRHRTPNDSSKATTSIDLWKRPKPQPILLSLWLKTSVALAGSTDHLPYSIHYGIVCKTVTALVEDRTYNSLEHLAESVSALALGKELGGEWVKVSIEKPRALLRADAAGISIVRTRKGDSEIVAEGEDKVFVKDLRLVTIIGVNACERLEKQNVVLNLVMHKADSKPVGPKEFDPNYNFRDVVNAVSEHVEKSDYKTVEAFVTEVARECCVGCNISKVTVRAEKPSALTFAASAGVEITRERSFFAIEEGKEGGETHDAFIALGSNVGDRYQIINDALAEMDKRGLKVKKTSNLYQSAPMYVEDQPTFLNGVCQVPYPPSPLSLALLTIPD